MPDDDDGDEHGWELLLPFNVVTSAGGPYDDDSFVAGFVVGTIDVELKTGTFPDEGRYVYPALLPQLDLLAMNYKLILLREPHDEHWMRVRFERAPAE